MIRRFIGSDADRIGPLGEAIRIRAIGSDPQLIADQSDPLGALCLRACDRVLAQFGGVYFGEMTSSQSFLKPL